MVHIYFGTNNNATGQPSRYTQHNTSSLPPSMKSHLDDNHLDIMFSLLVEALMPDTRPLYLCTLRKWMVCAFADARRACVAWTIFACCHAVQPEICIIYIPPNLEYAFANVFMCSDRLANAQHSSTSNVFVVLQLNKLGQSAEALNKGNGRET